MLLGSIYVDDILTGANSIEEASQLMIELVTLLDIGGFELGKWASNNLDLLHTSHYIKDVDSTPVLFSESNESFKVLGLQWDPKLDSFSFKFEPSQWLAPVIFMAKKFMQTLWQGKSDWDELLSS